MSTPTEPGLLLRLAGPLQSWGERSHFNERDTARFPTRSGVIGLLASALGRHRGSGIDDLNRLSITIRTDRPGVILRDLHTVGGGLPAKATVTTAEGKKRPGDTGTLLTHRSYLADAAFTLALTAPGDTALLESAATALTAPHWPPYLGRRSCPPEGPLLLGHFDNALHHLVHLPLAAPPPRDGTQPVDFLSDHPLDHLPAPHTSTPADTDTGAHPAGEVNDQPLTFHTRHRAYRARPLYRRILHLPATQHTGLGTGHLHTLAAYLNAHLNQPERSMR
ncbi:type I-E CRISPR-associated protein Cas5/CasD [Streptomyces luteogriseus]|uniref:type I-E CRISPR-associated protein Cas5/CasD n=1 Tax=Streptomyces luteogriseus TaxID=68233 RepID=UPI003796E8E5